MKPEEIVERIMTQHWDLSACNCWICANGRAAGLSPRAQYPTIGTREHGGVHVDDETIQWIPEKVQR